MRGLPALFTLSALLSGCTVIQVDRRPLRNPAEEPAGEIRFLAVREEKPQRLSGGYRLTVMKDFSIVDRSESSKTGPAATEGLKPGTYDISVAGRGIGTHSAQVRVRAGQATIVRLMVRNARRLARCGEHAVTAGNAFLYTVGGIVGGVVYVALLALSADCDDDDDDDDLFESDRSMKKDKRSPRPGSVAPYRKKN